MTKAPERVCWVQWPEDQNRAGYAYTCQSIRGLWDEYIHADTARQETDALVAAAYVDAANTCKVFADIWHNDGRADMSDAATRLASHVLKSSGVARAAYKAALERARQEGFEAGKEAAAHFAEEVFEPLRHLLPFCDESMNKAAHTGQHEAAERIADAIRALPINAPLADEMQRDAERRQAMDDLHDKKEHPDTSGDEQQADDELCGKMDHG